jgi:hypothetical protein
VAVLCLGEIKEALRWQPESLSADPKADCNHSGWFRHSTLSRPPENHQIFFD